MSIRAIMIGVMLTAFSITAAIAQVAADKPEPSNFPAQSVNVTVGGTQVTLHVALDELHITTDSGSLPRTAPLQAAGTIRSITERSASLRLNAAAASTAELNLTAAAAESAGNTAHAVAYYSADTNREEASPVAITNRVIVKPSNSSTIQSLANQYGFRVIGEALEGSGLFEVESTGSDLLAGVTLSDALSASNDVDIAEPVLLRTMHHRLVPSDTFFPNSWHLQNTGQGSGIVEGNDINVVPAWDTATGAGVNIVIVDSGIQNGHPDLAGNARTDIDVDFFAGDNDSSANESHGTAVAGIAAGVGNNGTGITGVAFDSNYIGVRSIVTGLLTDVVIGDMLSHQVDTLLAFADQAHVSNNSWGPADISSDIKVPIPAVVEAALVNGVTNGRDGRGVIYAWAGGNGRENNQDVNMDGFASSRYTIAVGASGGAGDVSFYSEPGASLLVNAPSSFETAGIFSTVPIGNYTNSFGGTSAATPMVAGVIALLLEVNPNLGWRDVQHILVQSSTRNDPGDAGWVVNGGGFSFHHDYGYGRVNANAAVNMAASWTPIPAQFPVETISQTGPSITIPDANLAGVTQALNMETSNEMRIEHVELEVDITHDFRGDLNIHLTSPGGMRSIFTKTHNDAGDDYSNYLFTSMAHFGEDPNGVWTINVFDGNPGNTGQLNGWTVRVYGSVPLENITPGTEIPTLTVPFFESDSR